MKLLIKNGCVIDPVTGFEGIADVITEGDTIAKIVKKDEKAQGDMSAIDREIDAAGCYVMPGFVDLHVHLRDPGLTHKETVETGAKAAARGGFTTICAMPNTKPVMDNAERVAHLHRKAKSEAPIHVLQIGAVTVGQQGAEMADIAGMAAEGAPAISEDGKTVRNTALYMRAMKEAKKAGIAVFAHCEDPDLVGNGVMHQCEVSEKLGLPGISKTVEDVITIRDILLAKEAGVPLHICHVSTDSSVELIRFEKSRGAQVTAEVCPHHFTLSVEDIKMDDPLFKMNPPLRGKEDVEALIEGLKDGTIDVIATDHAPHTLQEKGTSFIGAPFGIVGSETAAALTYSELVQKGHLTMMQMAEKMSTNPAKIIGLDKGTIQEGKTADLVIFDPNKKYRIDSEQFASKGINTPFHGRRVSGFVKYTICDGKIAYDYEGLEEIEEEDLV